MNEAKVIKILLYFEREKMYSFSLNKIIHKEYLRFQFNL